MKIETEWQNRFEERQRSGLSISEWCRRKGIRANQYYYWWKRLGANRVGTKERTKESTFVELGRRESLELQIGDEIRIRISANFDRDAMKALLELLGC